MSLGRTLFVSIVPLIFLVESIGAFEPLFDTRVDYNVGSGPVSVFSADLDGDADYDLAVANLFSDNISILMNKGDGTFTSRDNYSVGNGPACVFAARLDGGTSLDLAVVNKYDDNVSVMINNGDGTFKSRISYGVGDNPSYVYCEDLDKDGDVDLAVANEYSDNISILKNNGDGTFQAATNFQAGDAPSSVFCADLDGDSDLDLAVANLGSHPSWIGKVSVLKNNGDGTFQTPVSYAAGTYSLSVFCADLDGDSDLDLAVANGLSGSVSVLKNNGDGTFSTKLDYPTSDYPFSVFCADIDGNSSLDIVTVSIVYNAVSVLKNYGDGTFQSKAEYGAGDTPVSLFCADLDGDSDLDLAVANQGYDPHPSRVNNVSILRNYGNGTFPTRTDYEVHNPDDLCSADFDKDGDLDLVSCGGWRVTTLKNNGDATFQSATEYGVGKDVYSLFCADLDNDSDYDLAALTSDWDSSEIFIFMNKGDGTLEEDSNYVVELRVNSIFCADLDGDSAVDLIVSNDGIDSVSFLKNNGDGTFQAKVNHYVGDYYSSIFCDDLDLDNDIDLVILGGWGWPEPNVSILKNNGDGTFQPKVDYGAGNEPISVHCADLDGDKVSDIAVANKDSVCVLKNNGDGTFQTRVCYDIGNQPISVFCADFDGDSYADLAVLNEGGNVSVSLNSGDGTFNNAVAYGAGVEPTAIFCGDFDGDSDVDIAVSNYSDYSISILLNQSTTTGIEEGEEKENRNSRFSHYSLSQNYPNPFNPQTVIEYRLDTPSEVTLTIYNIRGQLIKALVNAQQEAGFHQIVWDGTNEKGVNTSSGVYFCRLKTGTNIVSKKMIKLK